MELHTVGMDLGRTTFHLVGLNQKGEVVVRKKFSRRKLLAFTANRKTNRIRGLLLECDITLPKGQQHGSKALPIFWGDTDTKLSGALRALLAQLELELDQAAERITQADAA